MGRSYQITGAFHFKHGYGGYHSHALGLTTLLLTPGRGPYSGFIKNCHSFFQPSLPLSTAYLPARLIPAKKHKSTAYCSALELDLPFVGL
jgi:hypothetical protein